MSSEHPIRFSLSLLPVQEGSASSTGHHVECALQGAPRDPARWRGRAVVQVVRCAALYHFIARAMPVPLSCWCSRPSLGPPSRTPSPLPCPPLLTPLPPSPFLLDRLSSVVRDMYATRFPEFHAAQYTPVLVCDARKRPLFPQVVIREAVKTGDHVFVDMIGPHAAVTNERGQPRERSALREFPASAVDCDFLLPPPAIVSTLALSVATFQPPPPSRPVGAACVQPAGDVRPGDVLL